MFFVLIGIYHYMSEEHKLSPFFKRRIDHHKFEKMMRKGIIYMYQESNSLKEFKFKLVKATLENYIHYKYNINIEDLPHDDVDNFIDYMVDTYEPLLKTYYYNERKNSGNINENYTVDKSEDKKLKLLTKMIHQFFDDVSFIVIKKYENKPMIIVYFDNDEAGRQGETYFAEQIQRKIYEYTGIKLIPYWHTIQYNTDADFRLDAIKLKNMDLIPQYENERNDINESEDKKLKFVTKMIHEFFDEVSFIKIKKYENKPLIRVYFDNDEEAANEESYFAEQIQDKIYKYTGIKLIPYWHMIQYNTDADFRLDAIKLKYDDEGNVINESEENKKEKNSNYLEIIRELIEPFKKEDCVCNIKVSFDDDMYDIYLEFGTEELNDKFYSVVGKNHYVKNLKNNVKNTIINYLSIDNLYVGSYGTPRCG